MPRFVARPMIVEACQNTGGMLPDAFARSVARRLMNGAIEINTDDGPRPCKYGDWIVRGPDGTFTVLRDAKFEAMFVEQVPMPVQPAKRPYVRREIPHAEEV